MSSNNPIPNPGHTNQATARTVFRVAFFIALVALIGCAIMAVTGMVSDFNDTSMDSGMPSFFLWWFGVVVLLAITGGLFRAAFGGAVLRYASGEAMPVAKDAVGYLTDGQGLGGIGRTVDEAGTAGAEKTGPYCRGCGTRNDADAAFCDKCGGSLA